MYLSLSLFHFPLLKIPSPNLSLKIPPFCNCPQIINPNFISSTVTILNLQPPLLKSEETQSGSEERENGEVNLNQEPRRTSQKLKIWKFGFTSSRKGIKHLTLLFLKSLDLYNEVFSISLICLIHWKIMMIRLFGDSHVNEIFVFPFFHNSCLNVRSGINTVK